MNWSMVILTAIKGLGVIFTVLFVVSYTVYAERRISSMIQDRIGPNRVGIPFTNIRIFGLGQPIADAIKLLLKEDFTPAHVRKFHFWLAPALAIFPPLMVLAVVPFGSEILGEPMVIADLDAGILFAFALASLTVYGIVLAGWAANSKYPFLGAVRSSAQLISYEISLGLSVVPVFLAFGGLNLGELVRWQAQEGWLILPFWFERAPTSASDLLPALLQSFDPWRVALWCAMLLSATIFAVSLFAETNRLPFDLPECETELVGGYHTEYSSMKFALFFLGEYCAMIAGAAIFVTLFLGGWTLPGVPDGSVHWAWGVANIAVFLAKVILVLFVFIWVRWTLPRFRYDQLMRLGWVWFFEIALANIFVVAAILALAPR